MFSSLNHSVRNFAIVKVSSKSSTLGFIITVKKKLIDSVNLRSRIGEVFKSRLNTLFVDCFGVLSKGFESWAN